MADYTPKSNIPSQGFIDIQALLREIIRSFPLMIFLTVALTIVTFIYAARPVPYEVHATINIDPADNAGGFFMPTLNADTEIGRIRSWTAIERVVESIGIYGTVTLKNSPEKLGMLEYIAFFLQTGKKHEELSLLPIQVESLYFPERLYGTKFYLHVIGENKYSIKTENGNIFLESETGQLAKGPEQISLLVSVLNVPEGSVFEIIPRSKDAMIESILTQLKVTKRMADKGANLIDLRYFSWDPHFALKILQAVADDYIGKSLERTSESAQQSINTLESELNRVETMLRDSEEELSNYMQSIDVADVETEIKNSLETRMKLDQSLREIQLQILQRRQMFTTDHPAMKADADKEKELSRQLTTLREEIASLLSIKERMFILNRDIEQNTKQYEAILAQYTEAMIISSAVTNHASLLNLPRIVRRNLRNKALQVVVMGPTAGIILALGIIIVRANFRSNMLERIRQLDNFPTLSISDMDPKTTFKKTRHENGDIPEAMEDVISQFSYLAEQKKQNITLVTSRYTTPLKSRLTLKMARRFAERNGRVLLIDANIKHSYLAENTDVTQMEGFANAMAGCAPSQDIIHQIENSDLYYMPPGDPPMNMQILRDTDRFEYLLKEFGKLFNSIIVDLPSQQELPYWDSLLTKAGTAIHFLEKGGNKEDAYTYLRTVSQLAGSNPDTLHEILLHAANKNGS